MEEFEEGMTKKEEKKEDMGEELERQDKKQKENESGMKRIAKKRK